MRGPVVRLGVVACATLIPWAAAEARNPSCAGGIQYVVIAMRDKERGNIEDYVREINKAVYQLEMCAEQDTNDVEALGYLGWAYAEVDSLEKAGKTFARAIARLQAKGDRRKVEWAQTNRDHYWATAFNVGIGKIGDGQNAYPDFGQEPETAADSTLRAEAVLRYGEAIASLEKARLLKPSDGRTIRNLATAHALMGHFAEAEALLQDGLQAAPGDSEMVAALATVHANQARKLMAEGNHDAAIARYEALIRAEPGNAEHRIGVADAYFKRAQSRKESGAASSSGAETSIDAQAVNARKRDFKAAGDGYAKAAEIRPGTSDLPFNAALAYQNAGEYALAEPQWRTSLQHNPGDVEAISSLGWALAEQNKLDEAITVLHQEIIRNPKEKVLHRQMGAVYRKAGKNAKEIEELMVYLALQNGKPVADAAAVARKARPGSDAAKTLGSMGVPEDLYEWEADEERYETWFYWTKRQAHHFKGVTLVQKSDWTSADLTAATGGK